MAPPPSDVDCHQQRRRPPPRLVLVCCLSAYRVESSWPRTCIVDLRSKSLSTGASPGAGPLELSICLKKSSPSSSSWAKGSRDGGSGCLARDVGDQRQTLGVPLVGGVFADPQQVAADVLLGRVPVFQVGASRVAMRPGIRCRRSEASRGRSGHLLVYLVHDVGGLVRREGQSSSCSVGPVTGGTAGNEFVRSDGPMNSKGSVPVRGRFHSSSSSPSPIDVV